MATGTYEYQSDFARRYFTQGKTEGKADGKAEGKAEAVLTWLAARGVQVPDEARTRIAECTDLDQLDRWIQRAAAVTTIEELFTP